MACTEEEFQAMTAVVEQLGAMDVYREIDLTQAKDLWLEETGELLVAIMHRLRGRDVSDEQLYRELIDLLWSITSLCRLLNMHE